MIYGEIGRSKGWKWTVQGRLSARFNKGVTEKSTPSQFGLSQTLLIACWSFMANFDPALKSRIFEIAILKISTVLYHVKISWLGSTRITLDFWYVVCNKHLNKPAKIQAGSRGLPEFMAKKRSRGQPSSRGENGRSRAGFEITTKILSCDRARSKFNHWTLTFGNNKP